MERRTSTNICQRVFECRELPRTKMFCQCKLRYASGKHAGIHDRNSRTSKCIVLREMGWRFIEMDGKIDEWQMEEDGVLMSSVLQKMKKEV